MIATGLKHAAHSVAMERCATNLMNAARPDADNALPRFEPIIKDGPAAYWTRLPVAGHHQRFRARRHTRHAQFRRGHVRMQFAVLPAAALDGDTGSCAGRLRQLPSDQWRQQAAERLDLRQQVRAGRDVVRETVRYYLQPSSGDILIA